MEIVAMIENIEDSLLCQNLGAINGIKASDIKTNAKGNDSKDISKIFKII
jgi:hypothetical protein